jgi:hypothetical protein
VSHRFDSIDESERVWLDRKRRTAARRSWLLIGLLVLVAIFLAWLTVNGLPGDDPPRRAAPVTTTATAEQRAVADGQRALDDWSRFVVTDDPRALRDSFWANGPQYRLLAREARARDKPIGPPPYRFQLSGVRVLAPRPNERVLRAKVQVTRPGEVVQSYDWDVWLRRDDASGGRWRLWSIRNRG